MQILNIVLLHFLLSVLIRMSILNSWQQRLNCTFFLPGSREREQEYARLEIICFGNEPNFQDF